MQDAAVKGEMAAKAATGRKERLLLPMTPGMMVMNVPGNPDGEETEAGVVMQDIPEEGGMEETAVSSRYLYSMRPFPESMPGSILSTGGREGRQEIPVPAATEEREAPREIRMIPVPRGANMQDLTGLPADP